MRSIFVVMLWLLCLCATAQLGLNKRYDVANKGRPQTAFGIELVGLDSFMVFTGSVDLDSISPDTVEVYYAIYLQLIDGSGTLLAESKTRRPGHGIFLGWANCCESMVPKGFVIGGSSKSYADVNEARLMRMNAAGDTIWIRTYGGFGQSWVGQQVKTTSDGGFIICGDTDAIDYLDGFVLKTDSLGNELWRRTYGWNLLDDIVSIDMAPNNSYYTGGVRFRSTTNSDFWVQRLSSLGDTLWSVVWGSPFEEINAHLTTPTDGQPVVAGTWSYAAGTSSLKPYLAKLDSSDGSILWAQQYGPAIYGTAFFTAKEHPAGDLIACGVSSESGDEQGLLLRTDSEGDSIWMRRYSYQDTAFDDGIGRFWDVLPTNDGGFIAAGMTFYSASQGLLPGYSQDSWVVKVDSMGCIVPGCDGVGIVEQVTNLEGALKVYPNPVPANGQLTVELFLPSSMHLSAPLRLVLTSMQGQLVKELALPAQHDQRVVLDVGGLAAGLYSVHVADGGRWLTGARLVIE